MTMLSLPKGFAMVNMSSKHHHSHVCLLRQRHSLVLVAETSDVATCGVRDFTSYFSWGPLRITEKKIPIYAIV